VDWKRHAAAALHAAARLKRAVLRGIVQDEHLDVIFGRQTEGNPGEDFGNRLLGVVRDDQNEETRRGHSSAAQAV